MTARIAINGLGRIGRLCLRAALETGRKECAIIAINDRKPPRTAAHLLKYDSVHGRFGGDIQAGDNALVINGATIPFSQHCEPEALDWRPHNVDIVLECTGKLTRRETAEIHIRKGARKVLISAPAQNADATIVYGVNDEIITGSETIVSAASCTTNCLAPVVKCLHRDFGIESGFATTVHAYTGDQQIIDRGHRDLARARAAGVSIIPSATGAARAIGSVLPELHGRIEGAAVRVPVVNVSLVDFCFHSAKPVSIEAVNACAQNASQNPLFRNVLQICREPLVSIDFNHTSASAIFDLTQTRICGKKFARVLAWYDNEWGFACRMLDLASLLFSRIP